MASTKTKTPAKKASIADDKCISMKDLLMNATNTLEVFQAVGDRVWINGRDVKVKDAKTGKVKNKPITAACLSTHVVRIGNQEVNIGKIQPSTVYNVAKHVDSLCKHGTLISNNGIVYIQAKKGYHFKAEGHQTPDGFYNIDSFKVEEGDLPKE